MKISIITATYNSEKTLRDTLDSILAQTYADIESIIVDGGSKDGTMDIVREYEPKFKGRMHWISRPGISWKMRSRMRKTDYWAWRPM